MKLVELIPYLLDFQKLEELHNQMDFNPDADEILIFMKDRIDLNSELRFFDSDETDGEMEIVVDDTTYEHFFSTYYASELIENDLRLKHGNFTNDQIAQRLLEYRLNDA